MSLAVEFMASTPSPSPSPGSGGGQSNGTSLFTNVALIAAIIAASAATFAAFLQRRTGKESAAASRRSAEASERSAKAAEAAVELNADTASAAGRRSDAESLSTRYQDASAQLGHAEAAVRLAGVYAMARLADDWQDQRQTCVDVLCAYLRMPERVDAADVEVRKSIVSQINQHTNDGRWSDLKFDFSRAVFRDFALVHCTFRHWVSFNGVRFLGASRVAAAFLKGASFRRCVVEGVMNVDYNGVDGRFNLLKVAESGHLNLNSFAGGTFYALSLRVEGHLRIGCLASGPGPESLQLSGLHVLPSGRFHIDVDQTTPVNSGSTRGELRPVDADGWVIEATSSVFLAHEYFDTTSFELTRAAIADDADINFRTQLHLRNHERVAGKPLYDWNGATDESMRKVVFRDPW